MNIKTLFLFLLLCRSFGAGAQKPSPPVADSLAARIAAAQPAYETLSARAKVTWSDSTDETSFQTSIRMKRDSVVWMSLSTAGIEGARLLIGRDSLRVLSSLLGTTTTHDLSYLLFWLPFPVNFPMLQQFLAGQRMRIGEKAAMTGREDSLWVLHTESDQMRETVWVDSTQYTLRKILLKDKLMNQDMEIIFEAYSALNGRPFPFRRLITIHHGPATMRMTVEVSRAKLNEALTYPFEK